MKRIVDIGECRITTKDEYQTSKTYRHVTNVTISGDWLMLIPKGRIPHYEPININNIAVITIDNIDLNTTETAHAKENVPR